MPHNISNAPTFGHIETSYKQSELVKSVHQDYGVKTKVTDSGVCMAMSAEYLMKNLQGDDFYGWLAEPSSKWQVLSQYLDNDYQALQPTEAQARIQEGLKTHFKPVGSYQLNADEFAPDAAAQAMSLAFSDDKMSFNMCYFVTPDGGPAHAVACIKDDQDTIRLMDPNIGELSFHSTTEFESWMSNVFDKHYSNFSHMEVSLYEAAEPQTSENKELTLEQGVILV